MRLEVRPVQQAKAKVELNKGFDIRLVRFEHAHHIQNEQFEAFCGGLDIKQGDQILDLGAGYGAATRELIALHPDIDVHVVLLDPSVVQLRMANRELRDLLGSEYVRRNLTFVHAAFPYAPLETGRFDHVLAKMVIHEMPWPMQKKALEEARRILKPNGSLTMWDVALEERTANFVRSVIRAKDQACGYTDLVRDRYLMTRHEYFELMTVAGFKALEHRLDIAYRFNARVRFRGEFRNESAFQGWVAHMRHESEQLSAADKALMEYVDQGDTITFIIPKMILRGRREQ